MSRIWAFDICKIKSLPLPGREVAGHFFDKCLRTWWSLNRSQKNLYQLENSIPWLLILLCSLALINAVKIQKENILNLNLLLFNLILWFVNKLQLWTICFTTEIKCDSSANVVPKTVCWAINCRYVSPSAWSISSQSC